MEEYTDQDKINNAVKNLASCLNHFFSIYEHTIKIAEKEELTSQEASKFRDNYLLGVSIGLEILGLLINKTLNEDNTFDLDKATQIATNIDWLRKADIWSRSVVRGDKISSGKSHVKDALKDATYKLGWS